MKSEESDEANDEEKKTVENLNQDDEMVEQGQDRDSFRVTMEDTEKGECISMTLDSLGTIQRMKEIKQTTVDEFKIW